MKLQLLGKLGKLEKFQILIEFKHLNLILNAKTQWKKWMKYAEKN